MSQPGRLQLSHRLTAKPGAPTYCPFRVCGDRLLAVSREVGVQISARAEICVDLYATLASSLTMSTATVRYRALRRCEDEEWDNICQG